MGSTSGCTSQRGWTATGCAACRSCWAWLPPHAAVRRRIPAAPARGTARLSKGSGRVRMTGQTGGTTGRECPSKLSTGAPTWARWSARGSTMAGWTSSVLEPTGIIDFRYQDRGGLNLKPGEELLERAWVFKYRQIYKSGVCGHNHVDVAVARFNMGCDGEAGRCAQCRGGERASARLLQQKLGNAPPQTQLVAMAPRLG
mmetsp:Transcript_8036/g.19638  ORF Transcript_8036/g.19638 Transcript_8036/m.19638 type:complete len:200 (-) Transcript_8036:115-714(-)